MMNTGNRFRSCVLKVMSLARCRCAMPVKGGAVMTAWQILINCTNDEYRQQVSILCPQGYEPCALPLRHAGERGCCDDSVADSYKPANDEYRRGDSNT